jgi:hypothetical protein
VDPLAATVKEIEAVPLPDAGEVSDNHETEDAAAHAQASPVVNRILAEPPPAGIE